MVYYLQQLLQKVVDYVVVVVLAILLLGDHSEIEKGVLIDVVTQEHSTQEEDLTFDFEVLVMNLLEIV